MAPSSVNRINATKSKLSSLGFPLGLAVVYSLFYALYFALSDDKLRQIYHDYVVTVSARLINWISPQEQVIAIQNSLISAKAVLEVVRGCDGAGVVFLLAAAVLVFPASIKRKTAGLIMGFTLVYLLNQVRIIGLYFISVYRNDWFLTVHTFLAPMLIIMLCSLFYIWWAFGHDANRDE